MNDVRELCLKPSSRSPSRWPFAIAAERPLKCNARSLLGDNYARQKDSRRLRRCNLPLGGAGVGKEGRGTASEVGGREARAADDRACKNYQEFFIASFPPLFIASLCAPHGGSKLKALACASNKQHMLCHTFSTFTPLLSLSLAVAPASKPKLPRLLKRFE